MSAVAPDGSPVELYRLLPPLGEAEIVSAAAPPGAAVLELGCGTGRVTRELVRLGHPVVAVDESAEMLAHVGAAETVQSTVAELDLPRSFPVVLLGSHLLNDPDDAARRALLDCARRHLEPRGRLVVEWHPPEWLDTAASASGPIGAVETELADIRRDGDLFSAVVRYTHGDDTWTHPFTALRIDEPRLHAELGAAGLRFDGWLAGNHRWFAATLAG